MNDNCELEAEIESCLSCYHFEKGKVHEEMFKHSLEIYLLDEDIIDLG